MRSIIIYDDINGDPIENVDDNEEEAKKLNDEFEKDNELRPDKLMPKKKISMLKKQKTKKKKTYL